MSIVADLKQALQNVLAPEIRANSQAIADLQLPLAAIRNEIGAIRNDIGAAEQRTPSFIQVSEVRMLEAIKAAKTEMLLQLQVSLLTKQVEELKAHQSAQ